MTYFLNVSNHQKTKIYGSYQSKRNFSAYKAQNRNKDATIRTFNAYFDVTVNWAIVKLYGSYFLLIRTKNKYNLFTFKLQVDIFLYIQHSRFCKGQDH